MSAVVVTLVKGQSYDHLFSDPEFSDVGDLVAIWKISAGCLPDILGALSDSTSESSTPGVGILAQQIKSLPSGSVVFNWECSSGFADSSLPVEELEFISKAVDNGYMVSPLT